MQAVGRWLGLVLAAGLALQLFFIARIALMLVVDPMSTSVQRSEWLALQRSTGLGVVRWQQQWLPYAQISDHLKRAVLASEDDGFIHHDGIEWNAIEKAWEKNTRTQAQTSSAVAKPPKVFGGSTITQQLAKNLFLSGERTWLRKGQEFILALALEQILSKRRILEIYLNNVEWGEGVFGAEAAAQRYFGKSASRLAPHEAARLAVMLPAPKRFEKNPTSAYLAGRTRSIVGRMGHTALP